MTMILLCVILVSICLGSFANNAISYFANNSHFDLMRSTCFCGKRKLWHKILNPKKHTYPEFFSLKRKMFLLRGEAINKILICRVGLFATRDNLLFEFYKLAYNFNFHSFVYNSILYRHN